MTTAQKIGIFAATIITLAAYFLLGYQFERSQFSVLIVSYSIAFLAYFYLVRFSQTKYLFTIGICFRAVLFLCIPFLSQDFYRFIWDGTLLLDGTNPYKFIPNDLIHNVVGPNWQKLYNGMGGLSADHFSNYPPLNQIVFAAGAWFNNESIFPSVFVYRCVLVLADVGTFYYGRKLLVSLGQNPNKIYWYFLNPLVILEVTANLHFEGLMIFLTVAGLYYAHRKKVIPSAIFLAGAISTKLLPLLILPLFFKYYGWKKSLLFYTVITFVNVLLFLPFADTAFVSNFGDSIKLWFINFEFNASFYYIARAVGFEIKGYNVIGIVGRFIPLFTILYAGYLTFFRSNKTTHDLITNALYLLTFYFLISTTVHPWYVLNLLVLAIFTRHYFALIWTFTVILSYYAYSQNPFHENTLLLFIEYAMVISILIFEIVTKRNKRVVYLQC